ncbi:MAG: adenylate kinase [Clostridiales bacterium]|nr:adenylate kinase [Clostridiales bacterium]
MNIIFLGPPGAGKGTQAQKVCEALSIPQISTGDILRRAIAEKTTVGLEAKSYMDKGQLVPDSVVIAIVKERLTKADCQKGYLLDGFPRTLAQGEALNQITHIDQVINLSVPDEKLISRLSGRRVCLNCGATYHTDMLEGETHCAVCGETLIQRDDDREETVKNRLKVYHEQTAPLIAFYEKEGKLTSIDGDREMSLILNDLLQLLKGKK